MNRLGTALTPAQCAVDVATGAIDLDGTVVVCQSADVTVAGYPRRALRRPRVRRPRVGRR